MKKTLVLFAVLVVFFISETVFAQSSGQDTNTQAGSQTADAPNIEVKPSYALLNNDYFIKSMKEKNLAKLKFDSGEYDESAFHSAEAERYAALSDQYIAQRLLIAKANKAIAAANDRISWAKKAEAATYYPDELKQAEAHYDAAIASKKLEQWDDSLENALAVVTDLEGVAAPPKKTEPPKKQPANPAQYKVRPWDIYGDCFWNIAYWFYKDYYKWPIIYKANKDKIPEPNNPDLIEIGTIIDIPSIGNEVRVGLYDTGHTYSPTKNLQTRPRP